jgi:hypothetical protein
MTRGWRVRLILLVYRRRLLRLAAGRVRRGSAHLLPPRASLLVAGAPVTIGVVSTSTRAATRLPNFEERLPLWTAALQHYFGAVARA